MFVIGITGPTGAGKTTALRVLEAMGGEVFDCDALYHGLLKTDRAMLAEIEAVFPGSVVDGRLDTKRLAPRVYGKPEALARLSAITHPYVARAVAAGIARSTAPFAVIDAIALLESGLGETCDLTVAVVADEAIRVRRLTARDRVSEEFARARIAAQHGADWFRARADLVLENNGTEAEFSAACRRAFVGRLQTRDLGASNPTDIETRRTQPMSEKTEELRKALLRAPKNGYDRISAEERVELERYCKNYMKFIDAAKTEREAVSATIEMAEDAGFVPFVPGMELKPGMKIYRNNRGKSIIFAVIGKEHIDDGAQIVASHIDSPRMDIKPNPLYEDAGMAYLKTHYYGGIKKYQWTTIPLSIHGIVAKKDGSVVTVRIGDEPTDPCFIVTDLLIHLSADQMKKTLAEGVTGENLNILFGSEPIADDEGADRVKLAVMQLLNEKYGIVEEDFLSAELTMVPASPAREIGLDRSLIGAYGHDDRVCAYASFEPLLTMDTPRHTAVCVLADKEEIGSVGVSGMQSQFFETFMADICEAQQGSLRRCLERSFCLSCDVSNAFDPIYAETCDRRNNSQVNYGIALCKYTGSRGKGGCSDASGEIMGRIRKLFDENGVVWQTAELGKVDQGGGGTVAAYMANRNIDTLDAGVPVLSMHAPMEVVSKLDCYMTMKGMKAVYND